MLISHRKRFIYTKTLKTGGTSVESYFEKFCMKEGEWTFSHGRKEYITDYGIIGYRGKVKTDSKFFNHMPAARIRDLIGEQTWNEYYKFCVIRSPYDKLISSFFHFEIKQKKIVGSKKDIIEMFRKWARTEKGLMVDRGMYVIDGKICMNAFIRYEYMLADLEKVCNSLKVPFIPGDLPRLKVGFRAPDIELEEFFDRETNELVKSNYGFEFRNFNYSPLIIT